MGDYPRKFQNAIGSHLDHHPRTRRSSGQFSVDASTRDHCQVESENTTGSTDSAPYQRTTDTTGTPGRIEPRGEYTYGTTAIGDTGDSDGGDTNTTGTADSTNPDGTANGNTAEYYLGTSGHTGSTRGDPTANPGRTGTTG